MIRVFSRLAPIDRVPLVLVALSIVTIAVAAPTMGFGFAWESAIAPAVTAAFMGFIAWLYGVKRPDPRLAEAAMATVWLLALTNVMLPLSYLAMAVGGPLWDERFMALDRALGFDWFAYAAFVNDAPWLAFAMSVAYQSMLMQAALAALLLPVLGQGERLKIFIAAFGLAALATIAISAFTPAVAIWAHYAIPPERFPNLDVRMALIHMDHVTGLRDGSFRTLMVQGGEGIITFPSFHTAFGVLLIHAFWRARWWVSVPAVALNLLMIASTPLDGGHYIVDVIAGAVIAGLAIVVASRIAAARAAAPATPFLAPRAA